MTLIGSPQDDKHGRGPSTPPWVYKHRPYGKKSGSGNRRGSENRGGRGNRRRSGIEFESGIDSSEHLMRGAGLLDAQGDLVGDADAVAFEGDDFFGVIGEDADVLEAEVD